MKSPICVTNIWVTNRKQTASVRMVGWMLAIAPLWLMLAAANTSQAQTTSSPADWTQFHRDNMQRWNPYETVLGVNNVGKLGLKWRAPFGTNTLSSPSVVNGVVYVGANDGKLSAMNANTGVTLWSYATGGRINSSPAVADGAVYFGSWDNKVYAVNATTGVLLWSYPTGNLVDTAPAVANGVVYIGSRDGNLYALNGSTGALLWSYTTGGAVLSSPAVVNGVVYFGSFDGNVYALSASTGVKLWNYSTGYPVDGLAVANRVLYTSTDYGNLYALNAATGTELWHFQTGNYMTQFAGPAVANGVAYVGDSDGLVLAVNASTGALLWTYSTGLDAYSPPAVANGVVYVGPAQGNVYALDADTGALLWSYTAEFGYYSAPVVVDGVVYTPSGGFIYAFGLGNADLFLRIRPTPTTVQQGDLITYAFPVWNLGPDNAYLEVLNTEVPAGTTFDYIRISGTPGLGTCTTPAYGDTGTIVCNENSAMAPNTTWTVRLTVKVTAPSGTVITESATATEGTFDPNPANNTATVSLTVQ